ncbi:hypothetical protein BJV74DRAFT_552915 [Russula compacta]|nr:hypothetical protein BJV74DRAFT_552915 [Russula compacta]
MPQTNFTSLLTGMPEPSYETSRSQKAPSSSESPGSGDIALPTFSSNNNKAASRGKRRIFSHLLHLRPFGRSPARGGSDHPRRQPGFRVLPVVEEPVMAIYPPTKKHQSRTRFGWGGYPIRIPVFCC